MKQLFLTLTGIFLTASLYSQAPRIQNTRLTLKGDKLFITYDITGNEPLEKVWIEVTTPEGKTITPNTLAGDTGHVTAGTDKQMVWDMKTDGYDLGGMEVSIEITSQEPVKEVAEKIPTPVEPKEPEEKQANKIFVSYTGNLNTPLGLKFGMIGNTGFYAAVKLNTDLLQNNNVTYHYEDGAINDFNSNDYYTVNNKLFLPELSITGGINQTITKNIFGYAGLGYYQKNIIWQLEQFDENETYTENHNIKNNDLSRAGLITEAGITLRLFDLMLLSAGAQYDLNYINWSTAIGLNF